MAMQQYNGGCHCGNVSFTAWLRASLETYSPRACDCDFCCLHSASYLSDTNGKLEIDIKDVAAVSQYKQGGELATFLICKHCGVLVAVSYEEGGVAYAAINSKTMLHAKFAESKTVSPKLLSNENKVSRWKNAWFASVLIRGSLQTR